MLQCLPKTKAWLRFEYQAFHMLIPHPDAPLMLGRDSICKVYQASV